MSLKTANSSSSYILPASYNSVPVAMQSNKSSKPIPCMLNTVNVPSLSGNQSQGGNLNFQLPLGSSAGWIGNAYLKFTVQLTGATDPGADRFVAFKGSQGLASAIMNRYSLFVNSVLIDNIQNADKVYDDLFAHSTAQDYLSRDAVILMGRTYNTAAPIAASPFSVLNGATASAQVLTFVVPLLGVLGSQQYFPACLTSGTMQVSIDLNQATRAFYASGALTTNFTLSNAQLVYDKISPEQSFIDQIKAEMAMGQKFVYGYTNYQSTSQAVGAGASSNTLNLGINVSSLRGVVLSSPIPTGQSTITVPALSISNGLNNLQVSLDGRQINSVLLDSVSQPAVVFAEMNRALGRIFDASITDACLSVAQYQTIAFLAGVSAQRSNEGLAFSGSPCSVLGVQSTYDGTAVAVTQFYTIISDYQLLIDGQSVEILR